MYRKISDGCTSAPNEKFKHCCVEHDLYYHAKSLSRLDADNKLFSCILKKGELNPVSWLYYLIIASAYWFGVRLFGGKYYGV